MVRSIKHACTTLFLVGVGCGIYVCMATHIAREWINRVIRLPVLLVVSCTMFLFVKVFLGSLHGD